jgi:ABC-type sugar transport system substrate-binding protein
MRGTNLNVTAIRRIRAVAGLGGALAIALAVAGCSPQSNSHRRFTIGVAEASTSIPFLKVMDASLRAEAKKLGMATIILDGQLNSALQAGNIASLVRRKVDLILVVSSDPDAVTKDVNRATQAGIPVMALNAELRPAAQVVTYIGDSDFDYGAGEGNLLVQALPGGGNVAVILGPKGDSATSQRLAGIVSVLASHQGFHIIDTPSDNFDVTQNLAVTQALLVRYSTGTISAIIGEGPQMYAGANYAKSVGRFDVKFIAGDYPTEVQSAIKSGALFGTVDQSPQAEGILAAKYAHDWLIGNHGAVSQPKALISLPVVTLSNVASTPAAWSMSTATK